MSLQAVFQTQSAARPMVSPTANGLLQRQCACGQHTQAGGECEECKKKHEGVLQRASIDSSPVNTVPPIVFEVLRSPGQALDAGTRAFMEPRFGQDFSGVRVHTDAKAADSARKVNARAYTVRRDVVFGAGQYNPATVRGRQLLAHELSHVVQQRGSSLRAQCLADNQNAVSEGGKPVRSEKEPPSMVPILSRMSNSSTDFPILQREIVTGCMAPSEIPGISDSRASAFGLIAEGVVTADYCIKLGCAIFATDYFDNPIAAGYIAFLAANNPHLTPTDIITLAVLSQIDLNRPDILTHKLGRKEFEEIKPNSVSGRAAGAVKVGNLIGFYGIWSLPYVPGITYVPTPEILIATAPGPIEVFLRIQRQAPGRVVYDICVRGDKTALTIAAIIAILLFVIAIYLSRGRILRGAPIPIPVLATADLGGGQEPAEALQAKLTLGSPGDIFEREADQAAAQIMEE